MRRLERLSNSSFVLKKSTMGYILRSLDPLILCPKISPRSEMDRLKPFLLAFYEAKHTEKERHVKPSIH